MLRFRPLWKFTAFMLPLFLGCIALGVWQLERLQWKLALIAEVAHNVRAKPVELGHGGRLYEEWETNYQRVTVRGRFDNAKESYVYGIGPAGVPVYHVIVPFRAEDGEDYLVDRGIVPQDLRDPARRPAGIARGETTVTGIWRWAERPGIFTPTPDLGQRVWFFKDVAAIARTDGVRLWQDGLIEADATPNPGGWPKGGQTVVQFRNEHLQYAITWFGLAAVTLGGWIAFHISRGRLVRG